MKKVIFILALVLALTAPAVADTNLTFALTKPLCSFPFGSVTFPETTYAGAFSVQYDGRFYDESYAKQNSLPNGGIKFGLELGYYATPEERDTAVSKVISVSFVNADGSTHILTKAGIYSFTDRWRHTSHVADYTFWFGNAANAIGDWKIFLVHKSGIYSANFSVTEGMIEDSLSPLPVDLNILPTHRVCFHPTEAASEYRVRIFDANSNFAYDSKYILNTPSQEFCTPALSSYSGLSGRVEARLSSGYWITLVPCSPGGLNVFNTLNTQSRSSTYFTLP